MINTLSLYHKRINTRPSKIDGNCAKKGKRNPDFKKMIFFFSSFYKNNITTSLHNRLQTGISNGDRKLRPAARCPASAGSVC